jgi:NAD(P)-dependent dehydrogenase (short-subunit alcohol dehydrogenase family)
MTDRRRVVLVTGSTDGIGKATALALARAGHRVIVHGRNRPRVDAALGHLRAEAPDADLDGVSFDLGTVASVRKGVTGLLEKQSVIDVLINNAGIFAGERVVTEDKAEATFAVNMLGPFLLTALVTPALLAAGGGARVINVSSVAHARGRIHLDDLTLEKGWTAYAAYAQSKLAQVMHALSLAERHPADKVAAYSLHPGVVQTKLLRQGFGPVPGISAEAGAKTSIALATGELGGPSGAYFVDGNEAPPAPAAQEAEVRDELWQRCAELAGLV